MPAPTPARPPVTTTVSTQRALRAHRYLRPADRASASSAHLAALARRVTPRDRWLAAMLAEHRVLSTHHITALAWPGVRSANLRLRQLYTWRVVDRFQPFAARGSAPMHYVLDVAGAHLLAPTEPARELIHRHDRALGIATSPRLAHTLATNTFFTALATPQTRGQLSAWWGETRCARLFAPTVRPDGYGRWHPDPEPSHPSEVGIEWFLEMDLGTEHPSVLAAKLPGYHTLAHTSAITTPVLFAFPDPRRETTARHTLHTAQRHLPHPHLVPLATTHLTPGDTHLHHTNRHDTPATPAGFPHLAVGDLTGPVWRPLTTNQPLRLGELGQYWRLPPPPAPPHNPAPEVNPARDAASRAAPAPTPPRAPTA